MNIKKGDNVLMLRGKDRGKTGKVIKISFKDERVTIERLNIAKKHLRPKRQGEKGQIIEIPRLVPASRVKLVCPKCSKATRVGRKLDGEVKKRFCKKCDNFID